MSDPTTDPDDPSRESEEDDAEAALAATMGFSGFGGPKRRRLNSPSSSNRARPAGTGANEVQLGVRPIKSTETTTQSGKARKADLAGGGLAAFLAHGKGLPSRPPEPAQQEVQRNGREAVEGGAGGGRVSEDWRHGVRNERGDVAYFLPSFLEDPWEGLT